MKINIKFQDNKKRMKFDLNKNTVIYGLNGKGKTRILKTILALKKIAVDHKNQDITEMVSELNLESMIINDLDFFEVFQSSKVLLTKREKMTKVYIDDVKDAIEFYTFRMRDAFPLFERYIPNSYRRRISLSIDQGRMFIEGNSDYEMLSDWIRNNKLIIKNIRRYMGDKENMHYEDINLSKTNDVARSFVRELTEVTRFIDRKFFEFEKDINKRILNEEDSKYEREQLKKVFSDIKLVMISSFHEQEDVVFLELNRKLRTLNSEILRNYWINKNRKGLNNRIDEVFKKVDEFNNIMKNYTNIKLIVNEDGYKISKNDQVLDFIKLSSGERRLITMFINVLFSDSSHILIDEPELSLSVDFQSRIVADLLRCCKGKVVFAATHAPFIYEDFVGLPGNREIKV